MLIEGPLKLSVKEKDTGIGHELHLEFTPSFRQLSAAEQGQIFEDYVNGLQRDIVARDEDSADRQGMLTVLQIAEQLLPHIKANDVELGETIVVDIQPDNVIGGFIHQSQRQH